MEEKMRALQLFGAGDLRLVEIPVPEITEDEVLLKTGAASICGTDVRMWLNGYKGIDEQNPLTLGHEFAGTIFKLGANVPYYQAGMRIALQPNIGCGICDRCAAGNQHLCDDYKAFGINMPGAFAEYVKIPASAITRGNMMVIADGVPFDEASIAEPLSCVYNGFSKCFVKPGDYAMVVGAGPIGLMHAMLLQMAGASVMMNDVQPDRLALCRDILPGIQVYSGDDLKGFVMEQTKGRGLDVAITACPVPQVQAAMLPLMNYGGRINFFGGIPPQKQPVPIDTNLIHYRELYLTGSTRSSIIQFRKTLSFVEQKLLNISRVVSHRYTLDDALEAFGNARAAVGMKHAIVFKA
jgi:L-iditol 2-dehydrogenase